MGPDDLLGSKDPVGQAILDQVTKQEAIIKEQSELSFKGFPYIGKPYTVDKDNPPVLKRMVHTKQFDLTKDDHMSEYNGVLQQVADGFAKVSFEEKVYDADIKSWRILIRWYNYVYTEPKKKKEIKNDGKDSK